MGKFKLRKYQEKAQELVRECFLKGVLRVILCMPTGAGKTVTFANFVVTVLAKNQEGKVLILTDRKELLAQACRTLDLEAEPINTKNKKPDFTKRCFVGMVETISRRIEKDPYFIQKMGKIKLIIIDEAHKGNFKKIFKHFPAIHVIGTTATPISTSKKDPLKNYYQDIVCPVSINDLISEGYLMPARSKAMSVDGVDSIEKSWNGEFKNDQMFDVFNKSGLYDGVVGFFEKHAPGKKTLVFNVNIEHSKNMCEQFQLRGHNARHLDSKMKESERDSILKWFHYTDDAVLCNCGILTTGFDEPSVETIIVNRATTSLALWLQMCGRGSRPFEKKDINGKVIYRKQSFNILDFGSNFQRHHLWESEYDWEDLFFNPKKKRKQDVAPVKLCPECEAMNHASRPSCTECGYEFPKKEKVLLSGEMVEVTGIPKHLEGIEISRMNLDQLMEFQEAKKYKLGWLCRQVIHNWGVKGLESLAKKKGYKKGWLDYQKKVYKHLI